MTRNEDGQKRIRATPPANRPGEMTLIQHPGSPVSSGRIILKVIDGRGGDDGGYNDDDDPQR